MNDDIVGNKTDLDRKVPYKQGQDYADSENLLFMEVSWKSGENLSETFEIIVKEIENMNIDELTHQGQGLGRTQENESNNSWWYFY